MYGASSRTLPFLMMAGPSCGRGARGKLWVTFPTGLLWLRCTGCTLTPAVPGRAPAPALFALPPPCTGSSTTSISAAEPAEELRPFLPAAVMVDAAGAVPLLRSTRSSEAGGPIQTAAATTPNPLDLPLPPWPWLAKAGCLEGLRKPKPLPSPYLANMTTCTHQRPREGQEVKNPPSP